MPRETLSESESEEKRSSKEYEYGWSARVRCRIEYMVMSENAAEVGFSWTRRMKVERD